MHHSCCQCAARTVSISSLKNVLLSTLGVVYPNTRIPTKLSDRELRGMGTRSEAIQNDLPFWDSDARNF